MEKELYDVKICEEDMVIPTYEVGEPNKNPIFSEKGFTRGAPGRFILIR